MTMKKAVFRDIKSQFVLNRRHIHITSPLQSPAGYCYVRFEAFTAAIVKNAVFLDVTPCSSCKNRYFGLMLRIVFLRSVLLLLVTANVVPSSSIFVTLIMEAIRSSATSSYKSHMALTSQKAPFLRTLHNSRWKNFKTLYRETLSNP
jgi:hypothetical protein